MAKQNFWQRLAGGAVNAVLPGTPYSRYSGYNPTLTRNSIISGVIGQVAPGGGTIANTILNQTPSAQAASAGQQGIAGLMRAANASNAAWTRNQGFDIGNIQPDFSAGYGVTPSLPGYGSDPAPAPPAPWEIPDDVNQTGLFSGAAQNRGQSSSGVSTARGFSGIGPTVPGYLSFGHESIGGGVNPFMRHSKMIQ